MKDSDGQIHAFIISLVDILAPLPFEIIPGYFLDRARPEILEHIKYLLNISIPPYPYNPKPLLYEYSPPQAIQEKGQTRYQSHKLPSENWRYWTVWKNGIYMDTEHLAQASLLLKNEIEFGFDIIYAPPKLVAHNYMTPAAINYFSDIIGIGDNRTIPRINTK